MDNSGLMCYNDTRTAGHHTCSVKLLSGKDFIPEQVKALLYHLAIIDRAVYCKEQCCVINIRSNNNENAHKISRCPVGNNRLGRHTNISMI